MTVMLTMPSDGSTVSPAPPDPPPGWKVLVVDDDPAMHQVTRLALRNIVALGRPVSLINALSAADARAQLQQHPDIALVLLDVVMETEHAGLELVRHIRDELGNALLRIVLRTGQPGQAPERAVMVDYDINDYKEKTELTANKLYTTVLASLRTYQHMRSLARLRRAVDALGGLGQAVQATRDRVALAQALLGSFAATDLFTGARCEAPGGATLAQSGQPALDAIEAAPSRSAALGQPGQLHHGPGSAWLALPAMDGEPLLLALHLHPDHGLQDAAVLEQLARCAHSAVACWPH
jgi:CheY-like chemotaxis protein